MIKLQSSLKRSWYLRWILPSFAQYSPKAATSSFYCSFRSCSFLSSFAFWEASSLKRIFSNSCC